MAETTFQPNVEVHRYACAVAALSEDAAIVWLSSDSEGAPSRIAVELIA